MSPKTSKLAEKLRNQASAAIARGQEQPDDHETLELAWIMFQILIEKSKKGGAEEEESLKKRAAEAEELGMILEETQKYRKRHRGYRKRYRSYRTSMPRPKRR